MGWRLLNDVLGGPGRNRTTDTRIFKHCAYFGVETFWVLNGLAQCVAGRHGPADHFARMGGAWPCMRQAAISLTAWPPYCAQPLAVSSLLRSSWWLLPASLRGFGAAAVAWHSHFKLPNIDLALLLGHLLNAGAADENTHLDILTDEVVFSGIDIKSQVVG
jgi:hypothetical protein